MTFPGWITGQRVYYREYEEFGVVSMADNSSVLVKFDEGEEEEIAGKLLIKITSPDHEAALREQM